MLLKRTVVVVEQLTAGRTWCTIEKPPSRGYKWPNQFSIVALHRYRGSPGWLTYCMSYKYHYRYHDSTPA